MKQIAHIRFLFVAIFALAAVQSAQAARNWTGNTDNNFSNSKNWGGNGSGRRYFNNDNLTGSKLDLIKLTENNSGNIGLCFNNVPESGLWRFSGQNQYSLDNSGGSDWDNGLICIGYQDKSSVARFYAISLKTRHFTIGGAASSSSAGNKSYLAGDFTGELVLDNLDDSAENELGPVSIEATKACGFFKGSLVATNATINCSGEAAMTLEQFAIDKTGGEWTIGGDLIVGAVSGASATFTQNSGTVTVNSGKWTKSHGGSGTLNLNGGEFVTQHVTDDGGSLEVNFNGGTLKANAVQAYGLLYHRGGSGLTVNVGANGGTIDTGNFDITVPAAINAVENTTGAFTVTGGGSATFSGMGDLAGALNVGDDTTLRWFDQDGAVSATCGFTSLALGAGSTIYLDADATGFDALPATVTTTATTENPAKIKLVLSSIPAPTEKFALFAVDDANKIAVEAETAAGAVLEVEKTYENGVVSYSILAREYTWNDGTSGANWSAADKWLLDSAAATWADNNIAVFATAGDSVTLDTDVTAVKLDFQADATVAAGSGTLTVPSVSVVPSVSATISASTAGSLEKTGVGTLTLGVSRTDQTTLTEGTLVMANGATVDASKLTLGTDAAKPVVFDYGGQTLSADLTPALGGYDVSLTNGNFTSTAKLDVADGTLRVKKDSSVSTANNVSVGGTSATDSSSTINAFLEIDGGAVTNSASSTYCIIGNYGAEGSISQLVVKNGGSYYSRQDIMVAHRSTGYLTVDNSTVEAYGYLYFCNDAGCQAGENGYVSLTNNGVLAVQKITYGNGNGNGYFNFDGGTLKATASKTLLEKKDRLFVNVNAAGGTIDNNGKTITINADLLGAGDMTLVGSGKTTIGDVQTGTGALNMNAGTVAVDGGVTVARPTTVAEGATLTVAGTAQATVNTLTLEAGSTLNIASYSGTVVPLSVATLTLPAEGSVPLMLNGGAFSVGTYKILEKSGIKVGDVDGKLVPSTGSEVGTFSVAGNTLVLTVGAPVHGHWRASAGSGNFSDPGNWEDGQVPVAGDTLDFSGVTSSITINCGDLSETAFGAVTMGAGVITFTGSLKAASFSDTSKIAVDENSTVTLDGDLVFGGTTQQYIIYTVAAGGRFVVTGHIEASSDMTSGELFPYKKAGAGAIQAKGLVANEGTSDEWRFRLSSDSNGTANWIVGADGLSGSKYFFERDSWTKMAAIQPLDSDFTIATSIGIRAPLTLNTTGYDGNPHTITIGDGAGHGGIVRDRPVTIGGTGTVVANYDATALNTNYVNPFSVTNTATLALMPSSNLGTGLVTVNDGSTLQVAESAASKDAVAVTLGGNLTLKAGAQLGFNYTNRNAPKLDLTDKTVTFDEGPTTNVVVKISATAGKRGFSGNTVLTAGGKFAGVKVTLASGAPDWALGVDVKDGEIVLNVKPMPMLIIIR